MQTGLFGACAIQVCEVSINVKQSVVLLLKRSKEVKSMGYNYIIRINFTYYLIKKTVFFYFNNSLLLNSHLNLVMNNELIQINANRTLVTGGYTDDAVYVATATTFDWNTFMWDDDVVGDMSHARNRHGCASYLDESSGTMKALVAGGRRAAGDVIDSVEILDLATGALT